MKAGKLLPLNTGGKLRSYHILRHLPALHAVTFLSYYGGLRDRSYEAELQRAMPGSIIVHDPTIEAKGVQRYISYARCLPDSIPYSVRSFKVAYVQHLLSSRAFTSKFDIAVCDFLASAVNFPTNASIPTVLFQHNVESLLWKRRAQFASDLWCGLIARTECAKMTRYEHEQVRRFHDIFAVSEQDREVLAAMSGTANITVIPTGADLQSYAYDSENRRVDPLVIFSGSMDWEPNIDAVEYFSGEIWPHVLARIPGARFRIVGRDPDHRVRKLVSPSIAVTGTVDSMMEHLRPAAVLVVPLRIGAGTRIKIYEGMAMGKAIVSTTLGAEGLDVHDGHDIFLSDHPRRFAERVVDLLLDEKLRNECGRQAAITAHKHSWNSVAQIFSEALQRVLRAKQDLFAPCAAPANFMTRFNNKAVESRL